MTLATWELQVLLLHWSVRGPRQMAIQTPSQAAKSVKSAQFHLHRFGEYSKTIKNAWRLVGGYILTAVVFV